MSKRPSHALRALYHAMRAGLLGWRWCRAQNRVMRQVRRCERLQVAADRHHAQLLALRAVLLDELATTRPPETPAVVREAAKDGSIGVVVPGGDA